MLVEVDLYSGRPNPRFVLAAAVEGELRHRIALLAPTGGTGPPEVGLGYRGLRTQEFLVFGGLVTVRGADGPVRWLRDPGRALERWLLDQGAGELDAEVLTTVRRELAR
ncbi:hypothetical protein [Streptomyces sp. NRRL WC-3742]|uniref:hypothetical protein n=1 Tax=Streptomyces sp. NRRL WC-3742 TaxID=1463934 RepID=UPI0004C4AB43|nr:hypothetical protein [Streptomyces sp. NRRL WC-3742]